jgi:hypothetical protein
MHRGEADGGCRLKGACEGPLAALVVLLSNQGILPEPASGATAAAGWSLPAYAGEHLVWESSPPDSPPPRA